ncbi:glycoside hydrolase family 38 N-terminal domain-containing protein [Cucumibacter marinus]|uniref:glycoside hydrolase family 38 N-terminal domain-containing protein n=1 Tax=Cucumibacter marinus TaxID=1121252 RepID=UPI0004055EAD|nr:glycoside hydrolase family 38 C-terminal domain-containing protein [Cucumibacter marinus]
MKPIKTIYLINKSHTDIGFTDYQDICFRQHGEFIDQAMDLMEETHDYPDGARFRWVCEATGPLMRYLEKASDKQIDRFRHWHDKGDMEVTAMMYPHFTQAFTIEQLARSLYPVRELRDRYGFKVDTADQSDVTGVSWMFADLLSEIGVDFLTMSINEHRALAPQPRPGAFWWEGPSGGRVLVWNGYHYLFARSVVRIGDWRFVDRFLPKAIADLEANPAYPFDFLFAESTHPTRVDNGPPDRRMPEFVKKWNEEGRTPRIEMVTARDWKRILRDNLPDDLPVLRGDWTDWWVNGYASSAFEYGINRASHELMSSTETMESWLRLKGKSTWTPERADYAHGQIILGDELAWGAYSAQAAPGSLFSRSQWNKKANTIYTGAMETHDMLARAANGLADTVSDRGPEGVFNLSDLDPREAYPESGSDEVMVINPLPWSRNVIVEEPEIRGNTAPDGMLDMFFPKGVPWGGERPITPIKRVEGEVPGFGYAFLKLADKPAHDDIATAPGVIENAHYRLRIDEKTGALAELFDKDLQHDFAGEYRGWGVGEYVYEWIDSDKGRESQFKLDFSREDAGLRFTDAPYRYETPTEVTVHEPEIYEGRASIKVDIKARGIVTASCTYALEPRRKVVEIDWLLDKEDVLDPESVVIAFPFNMGSPEFRFDMGGVPSAPHADQIPGAVRDYFPIQRWASVSDGERGVVLASIEAPLVQLGGITSTEWNRDHFDPEAPAIMAWPLNNHWEVNFKASQEGEIPIRYRLTTHAGPTDDVMASRFAAEQVVVPIVLRDRVRTGEASGQYIAVDEAAAVLVNAKPGESEDTIVLRIQNLQNEGQNAGVKILAGSPRSAQRVSAIETAPEADLPLSDGRFEIALKPLEIATVAVRLG